MTLTSTNRESQTRLTQPIIYYQVAMPQPQTHRFHVTLQVRNWQESVLDLKMPVWTPGSYLVREYARHVQQLSASTGDLGRALKVRKRSKNHWQVETETASEITVHYQVYANELTVRTNHLDATHGYFNGAALFFYLPDWQHCPIQVAIAPPYPTWKISTPLPATDEDNTFLAENFDTLVDSPFEIGHHEIYEFEAQGKPHRYAVWGRGNANMERLIADTQKIITTEAEIYGGELPYDRYLFLLHLSGGGYGGLEHKHACSLNYPRFSLRSKDKYNRFLQLVAHEFFHLWNVKRIRPQAIETFDYDRENYTTSLWFCEGATSYYDNLVPWRAGLYDARYFLENLTKDISRLQTTPGRKIQPLSESSFDAWIKLYRRDAYSDNNQISYYLKGEIVSWLLDLLIRDRHDNQRSLDEVMGRLWEQFGKEEKGFTPQQLQAILETVADTDLDEFLHLCLDTTEELPYQDYLTPFGLQLVEIPEDEPVPYLGIKVQSDNGKQKVQFVEADAPAGLAGIDAGDELLAFNGVRVTADQVSERLKDYRVGDTVAVSVFHQDELMTYEIPLGEAQPKNYQLVPVEAPTPTQQKRFQDWLGIELASLS